MSNEKLFLAKEVAGQISSVEPPVEDNDNDVSSDEDNITSIAIQQLKHYNGAFNSNEKGIIELSNNSGVKFTTSNSIVLSAICAITYNGNSNSTILIPFNKTGQWYLGCYTVSNEGNLQPIKNQEVQCLIYYYYTSDIISIWMLNNFGGIINESI